MSRKILPVPSAATLSLAGRDKTELSEALFRAEAAMLTMLVSSVCKLTHWTQEKQKRTLSKDVGSKHEHWMKLKVL